jgi:hypothetical protein
LFDFQTVHAAPVRVTIDGTAYDVPRFLLPQFKAWCAARQKASVDAAMNEIGDDADQRARFMLYWQPAPIDVVAMLEEALSPEGVEYVVGTQLKAAGLEEAKALAVLASAGAPMLRALAKELLSATTAKANQLGSSEDPGRGGNPLPVLQGGSADSAETTPTTASPSPEPSPA